MSVKIKRNTGWVGQFPNFNIIINGEKVEEVGNNDTIQIEIPDEEATLQVSQWGIKSNEIIVNDGEKVEIYTTAWGKYSIFVFMLALLLTNLFSVSTALTSTFKFTIPVLLATFFIVTALVIRGLHYDIRKL